MPNTASAAKAFRQNARRKEKNTAQKEAYRKAIKEYRHFVAGKKPEDAAAKLRAVYQTLDKAAKGGAIKKNKASRLKARASTLLAKIKS